MQPIVLVFVSAAHLLAMNLACAGPVLCIWLRSVDARDESLADALGRTLAWLSLVALLLGMLIGGGSLLFGPSRGLIAALDRFPARAYWFGAAELLFSLVCLVIYASCWRRLARFRSIHAAVALLSTTNLFYHFPPWMAVIGKLATDPAWAADDLLGRREYLRLTLRGEVLALTLHFVLASIAVAAIAVLWQLGRRQRDGSTPTFQHLARRSAQLSLIANLSQLPVGVWLLLTLSSDSRGALTGDDPYASLLFIGGLLATMLLLQRLAGIALGDFQRGSLKTVGWLLVVVVVLMTATLRASRDGMGRNQRAGRTETASQMRPARRIGFCETASEGVNSLGGGETMSPFSRLSPSLAFSRVPSLPLPTFHLGVCRL